MLMFARISGVLALGVTPMTQAPAHSAPSTRSYQILESNSEVAVHSAYWEQWSHTHRKSNEITEATHGQHREISRRADVENYFTAQSSTPTRRTENERLRRCRGERSPVA